MQVDFSTIEDLESFVSVPEGTYLCRIGEVREGVTRDGSPRWAIRLEVAEGDYAGKTAAWDGLTWSERALPRVKEVLAKLGFDVSGHLEIHPDDLKGLLIRAHLTREEREDPTTGRRIAGLRVPFMGYQAADEPTPF